MTIPSKHPIHVHPWVLGVLLFIAMALAGSGWYGSAFRVEHQGIASLTIDFGDGRVRTFEGKTVEGMTAAQALAAASQAGHIRVARAAIASASLLTIDAAEDSPGGTRWVLYRNGVRIDEALEQVPILPGDALLLRFEQP